jgi:hypothetical protein
LRRAADERSALQSFGNLFTMSEMKVFPTKSIFFLLTIILFNACSGNKIAGDNSSVPNSNRTANTISEIVARDDVEELSKIIKLPAAPDEATYSEIKLSGGAPNNLKLVVILKFSTRDANQIATVAEGYKPPALADIDAEDWFPPELVAKSQETGDASLKGVEYAANDFLQPPYASGRLTRINDTNYFVLELFSA